MELIDLLFERVDSDKINTDSRILFYPTLFIEIFRALRSPVVKEK